MFVFTNIIIILCVFYNNIFIYYVCLFVCVCTCVCVYTCVSVFLISSYGAPLAQRVSNLAQRSSLFGPDGAVNYDYIVTNSIISLLIGSKCIPNGTHTNHC